MAMKGRPKKVRYVQKMPKIVTFSPRGKPGRPDEIELNIDEFESMKLADYQGFSQSQGAVVMRLSRASFGRILRSARKKISNALVNGKIIKIRMGSTQIGVIKSDFTAEMVSEEVMKYQQRQARIAEQAKGLDGVQPSRAGKSSIRRAGKGPAKAAQAKSKLSEKSS